MIKQIWPRAKHSIECAIIGGLLGAIAGGLYGVTWFFVASVIDLISEGRPVQEMLFMLPISLVAFPYGLIPGGVVGSITGGLIGGLLGRKPVTPEKAVRYGLGVAGMIVAGIIVSIIQDIDIQDIDLMLFVIMPGAIIYVLAIWWFMLHSYPLITGSEESPPGNSFRALLPKRMR